MYDEIKLIIQFVISKMFDIDNNSYQNNPSTTSWSPFLYTRKAGWSLLILNIYHKTRNVLIPQTLICSANFSLYANKIKISKSHYQIFFCKTKPTSNRKWLTNGLFMELIIGLEPMTSSLPRKCSTYWATSANIKFT